MFLALVTCSELFTETELPRKEDEVLILSGLTTCPGQSYLLAVSYTIDRHYLSGVKALDVLSV